MVTEHRIPAQAQTHTASVDVEAVPQGFRKQLLGLRTPFGAHFLYADEPPQTCVATFCDETPLVERGWREGGGGEREGGGEGAVERTGVTIWGGIPVHQSQVVLMGQLFRNDQ